MCRQFARHLYQHERVLLDGLEELAEDVVDQGDKIFVWLFFRQGFLIRQDGLEQL